jgi:hypothetical protein
MRASGAVRYGAILAALVIGVTTYSPAVADHVTPGAAGRTKVNVYDDTHNGWNVTTPDPLTGGADPEIGFVNFRPTIGCGGGGECDPNNIVVVVTLKKAAPNCTLTVQLVTSSTDDGGGLAPDGNHTGFINVIGTITTNSQGNGNTGAIVVDVGTLGGVAPSGQITYAHVDLEDLAGTCVEADGTPVENNEYGASGERPGQGLGLPTNIHWVQP